MAEIDALVKSGRYASRIAVLEAAFAALQREQTIQRITARKPGLPPTVTRFAGDAMKKRTRRTREDLEREARESFPRTRPKVNFTEAIKQLK